MAPKDLIYNLHSFPRVYEALHGLAPAKFYVLVSLYGTGIAPFLHQTPTSLCFIFSSQYKMNEELSWGCGFGGTSVVVVHSF